jgi:hypothetical protein
MSKDKTFKNQLRIQIPKGSTKNADETLQALKEALAKKDKPVDRSKGPFKRKRKV